MKNRWLIVVMLLALPAIGRAQNPDPNARRQALQGEIIRNFMDRVGRELTLDAATRTKLEQQMRQSGGQRRALAQSTAMLRRDMLDAERDSSTADAEFKRLLNEMTILRQKEDDLWKSDQDALAKILTPRQHAKFIFMWLRFNEQIREMALKGTRPGNRF